MSNNNNELIIYNYNLLLTDKSKNKFELNNYKKVISIIKDLNFEITLSNLDKLKGIKYIGNHAIKRIQEILETCSLNKSSNNIDDIYNKHIEIRKLMDIHGVGLVKANKLYSEGIRYNNIDKHLDKLTPEQQVGAKYREEIKNKIPRQEIYKYNIKLKKLLKEFNSDILFEICGSYRRGKSVSGDIDVLLTTDDNNIKLQDIINYLSKNKLLIDHLTLHGNKKYMGISKLTLKSIPRRIDIRLISKNSYNYALLYFTGSDNTNKYMRNIAKQKNWKLSEYSLIDNNTKKEFKVSSEEEIFKLLGIDYISPTER